MKTAVEETTLGGKAGSHDVRDDSRGIFRYQCSDSTLVWTKARSHENQTRISLSFYVLVLNVVPGTTPAFAFEVNADTACATETRCEAWPSWSNISALIPEINCCRVNVPTPVGSICDQITFASIPRTRGTATLFNRATVLPSLNVTVENAFINSPCVTAPVPFVSSAL